MGLKIDLEIDTNHGSESDRDSSLVIWRYMDFWKFALMLENQALYMCRADLLGDDWEGYWPGGLVEKEIVQVLKNCYVSCWHINKHENYAMWKAYVENSPGLAICTTLSRLISAFPQRHHLYNVFCEREDDAPSDNICYLERVKYSGFKRANKKSSNQFYKRRAFSYEKEIRIFAPYCSLTNDEMKGFYAPCNLSSLIQQFVLSPKTDPEFISFIKKTLKMYGLENVPVRESGLDETPPQYREVNP